MSCGHTIKDSSCFG